MCPTVISFKPAPLDSREEPAPRLPRVPGSGSGHSGLVTVALESGNKVELPEFVCKLLGVEEGEKVVLKIQPNRTVVMISLQRVVEETREELMNERLAADGRGSRE